MQFSRTHLERRLEQGNKELESGRLFLLAAKVIVALNLVVVGLSWWRGWRSSDYYYLFILLVWTGFFIVQFKIQQRKKAEVAWLEDELEKDHAPSG